VKVATKLTIYAYAENSIVPLKLHSK